MIEVIWPIAMGCWVVVSLCVFYWLGFCDGRKYDRVTKRKLPDISG